MIRLIDISNGNDTTYPSTPDSMNIIFAIVGEIKVLIRIP